MWKEVEWTPWVQPEDLFYLSDDREGRTLAAINETEKTMADQIKAPYLGAVVILHLSDDDKISNNYSKECAAIVSGIFGVSSQPPFLCNLKGLPDGTGTIWRTSIPHQEGIPGAVIAQGASWRWPDEPLKRGTAPMAASD